MIKRILLVNDDGIDAEGLAVGRRIAQSLCDDVWVVAPNRERSGSGCSLSFQDPIRLEQRDEQTFSIDGTPVDCVMVALHHLMIDKKPDLIISGVNHGQNIAEDLIYSGTVSGAMQGLIADCFSVALSQAFGMSGKPQLQWETAEHYAPKIIKTMVETQTKGAFNINFPDRTIGDVEGVAMTHQGRREFPLLRMIARTDPRNRPYYWMGFNRHLFVPEEGSDIHAVYGGKISITPLQLNWTDSEKLAHLNSAFASQLTQNLESDIVQNQKETIYK